MKKNIIIDTDSYKVTHHLQYTENLTKLYSYGEPRVGGLYPKICYFGGRMVIKDHFLQKVTTEMIDEAEQRAVDTFGTDKYFNRKTWEKVRDLGYLPIKIMAAPEGTIMNEANVCFTLESTEPWFAKNLNALETVLMHIWYPTTVATRSMYIKNSIKPWFAKSSDVAEYVLPVAVNDFGFRGATGYESAARAGAGHLLHFAGSDNEAAQSALIEYYGGKGRLKSVWATEHSVALTYGPGQGEFDYLNAQLDRCPENMIFSIVIDTYDSDNFVQNVVGSDEIKQKIIARTGRVVLRPDSGDPKINVIKYLDMLGGIFGYSINKKGYKVVNHNVGLIQGDGMDEHSIPELYKEIVKCGWAADNVVTGSGGGLLQAGITRDTSRWAIKPSYGEKDGVGFNMSKSPKTDTTKTSKAGLLKLHPSTNNFRTISSVDMPKHQFDAYVDALETVLENGVFNEEKFENILERASK